MKIRATFLGFVKIAAATAAVTGGLAACGGGAGGKLMVDTPVLPYQAPDISDITGIDEDDGDSDAGSGSGSATTPAK